MCAKDDVIIECPTCHGTGIVEVMVCSTCGGSGVIEKLIKFD